MSMAYEHVAGSDGAMQIALDRSLRRQRARSESAEAGLPSLRRMAGAPAAPGVRPQREPLLAPDFDIMEIERLDETDGDRFADLDVHFGRHRWSDDGY